MHIFKSSYSSQEDVEDLEYIGDFKMNFQLMIAGLYASDATSNKDLFC